MDQFFTPLVSTSSHTLPHPCLRLCARHKRTLLVTSRYFPEQAQVRKDINELCTLLCTWCIWCSGSSAHAARCRGQRVVKHTQHSSACLTSASRRLAGNSAVVRAFRSSVPSNTRLYSLPIAGASPPAIFMATTNGLQTLPNTLAFLNTASLMIVSLILAALWNPVLSYLLFSAV